MSDKLALAKKLAEKIQMRNKDETQQAAENFLNKGIICSSNWEDTSLVFGSMCDLFYNK